MKVYIINENDINQLLLAIDRDPAYGTRGGSSAVLSERDRYIYDEAHRFYNYQVRNWVERIKGDV